MNRLFLTWLLALAVSMGSAQTAQESTVSEPLLRDVFCQMPDSLIPTLTHNNRLDFIDFLESNMKAVVRNQFGGRSEMTVLTSDSLSVQVSSALRIDMLLLPLSEPIDSVRQVVVLAETWSTDSLYGETVVTYYTPDWHRLTSPLPLTEAQQQRINSMCLQTILKWDEDKINKS